MQASVMPYTDHEIRRAYKAGHQQGIADAAAGVAGPAVRFADADMQRAFERGWTSGSKYPQRAEERRAYRQQWYQRNRKRIVARQRKARRSMSSETAVAVAVAIAHR